MYGRGTFLRGEVREIHHAEFVMLISYLWGGVEFFYILTREFRFRRSQVGLRRAETAFQNDETPLLFGLL